jgi:hypothetical protein
MRQISKSSKESKHETLILEKSILQGKNERLAADLDNLKLKLIQNEIKTKKISLERADISSAKRIKTKYL